MDVERHDYDVLVIGAGGAGLRAAIAAAERGARTALVCKSLLGKAHTVMAEGGVAASLGNVAPEDNWQVHFQDTMFGGKYLNNWRMAELHAKEAPDRVRELERWGGVFDRTPGPQDVAARVRRAHVQAPRPHRRPHRPGADPHAAGQGRARGHRRVHGVHDHAAAQGRRSRLRRLRLLARDRASSSCSRRARVVLATGGAGKCWRITSNSWECTGDGHALAYEAGAELIDMEFVQFHPTGMVWPPGVVGLLVTEAVRGEGGILRNAQRRAVHGALRPEAARALDPRRRGARDLHRGQGGPRHARTAASSSTSRTSAPRPSGSKLPSMYDQFMELAGVDITREPMEVGPTCHYFMGGIRVDAETGASTVDGLFAAGECSGGMNGANRLGGNSLSDLLVFGRRAGERRGAARRTAPAPRYRRRRSSTDAAAEMTRYLSGPGDEDPYRLHARAAGDDAGGRGDLPRRGRTDVRDRPISTSSSDAPPTLGRRRARPPSTPAGTCAATCATC